MFRAISICFTTVIALATPAGAQTSALPSRATVEWSESELRSLKSLSISRLTSVPHDPSNRYADNTEAARLGHRLFFDERLSRPPGVSCATCHQPELNFTDGLARSRGHGQTPRGAPTVVGTAHSPWFYWDGRRDSQWSQALTPLETQVEMDGRRIALARLIASDPDYQSAYESIFGALPDLSNSARFPELASPLGTPQQQTLWKRMSVEDRDAANRVFANIGKALAAYQRKLMPGPSRFDRYVDSLIARSGTSSELTEDEVAGLRLFVSPKAQCMRCHNGPLMTNHGFHNVGVPSDNAAQPDLGRVAATEEVLEDPFNCLGPYSDAQPNQCLELNYMKRTGEELRGAFKVPSLRNVSRTAPYMHAGQFETLAELLQHYNRPRSGVGHLELNPLQMNDRQLVQLESFLRTLDSEVAAEPSWLNAPVGE